MTNPDPGPDEIHYPSASPPGQQQTSGAEEDEPTLPTHVEPAAVQAERHPPMPTTPWYLEIVHVSSREKQQDLLRLLQDVASVTALGTSSGPNFYVVFECPDRRLKTSIEILFGDVDPASVLTETHQQPVQSEGGEIA